MFFDDKKFLGSKIQTYRRQKGLTQFQLAEKIGLSEKHISKIESGIHQPSITVFFKLIHALEISLDEFGINIAEEKQSIKYNVLKLIYDMNDRELAFLFPILKVLKDNFEKNKL